MARRVSMDDTAAVASRRVRRVPAVQALLAMLDEVQVKVVERLRVDGEELRGRWLPENKMIIISKAVAGRWDELVVVGLHELCHAYFDVHCGDLKRMNHDVIARWEYKLFRRSRALREEMGERIGNAALYGIYNP